MSAEGCVLCPRRCGVLRGEGKSGFCGETDRLRLASASIHRGEEPPVSGDGGSGTIFVTGCGLGCEFCQNRQIARQGMGRAVGPEEFAEICLALAERGAENINIVTGSHAAPALAEGIGEAKKRGLALPVLWNSSAWELPEVLETLGSLVDVWLPDLKTLDRPIAERYFHAADYPEAACRAILKMLDLCPGIGYNRKGGIVSGVIIRHLILPGHAAATRDVIRWYARHCPPGSALLSLMTQYTPIPGLGSAPSRFVSSAEYDLALGWLEEYGVEDGFLQELVRDSSWFPDFSRTNPFSSDLSVPVWHWKTGLVPAGAA